MNQFLHRAGSVSAKIIVLAFFLSAFFYFPQSKIVRAEATIPQQDQNQISPLNQPDPNGSEPRYLSGFGLDNSFTIFFEERKDTAGCGSSVYRIYFNQTNAGVPGLSSSSTKTDICDSHFLAKNWPITISGTTYKYRAWGAQDYSGNHLFYVSNDLIHWTSTPPVSFTFSDPDNITKGDAILYGFHDIVEINNNYIGFAESAGGHTYIVWSDDGDSQWKVVALVGGVASTDSPLNLGFTDSGIIPTGNFVIMKVNGELVYAKGMIPANRSGMYLAVNHAAAVASTPALAEAAFMNPANWTWQDGTTGLPAAGNAILASSLTATSGHDVHEGFILPVSDADADAVILYDAAYAGSTYSHGLGCAASSTECLVVIPSASTSTASIKSTAALPVPVTGFAPDKITPLHPSLSRLDDLNIRLQIPSLKIDQAIVGVSQTNDSWDLSWLGNNIGYLDGTTFPTWDGNSVLTGHVFNADGQPGIFIHLDNLRWGDRINIQLAGQNYLYEVREVKIINASKSAYVFRHETRPWITLVTCKGYNAETGNYDFRTVVKAVLISVEK
jgi:LPXTG-site transpeptidase (sortase) family protein